MAPSLCRRAATRAAPCSLGRLRASAGSRSSPAAATGQAAPWTAVGVLKPGCATSLATRAAGKGASASRTHGGGASGSLRLTSFWASHADASLPALVALPPLRPFFFVLASVSERARFADPSLARLMLGALSSGCFVGGGGGGGGGGAGGRAAACRASCFVRSCSIHCRWASSFDSGIACRSAMVGGLAEADGLDRRQRLCEGEVSERVVCLAGFAFARCLLSR
eukprot:scaffold7892_cov62-Phaeocystis_antarctica.AAC.1